MQENANQAKEKNGSQKKPSRIFRETKWQSKLSWIVSLSWVILFILKWITEGFSVSANEALQIGMLFLKLKK